MAVTLHVQVGDIISGADGLPTVVTGVYPQGERPVYKILFSDGVAVEADALEAVVGAGLDRHPVAAQHFLRFGERAVRHPGFAAGERHARAHGRRVQAVEREQDAALEDEPVYVVILRPAEPRAARTETRRMMLAQETRFALKGGTAINLFEDDLPRLSVDIDLNYIDAVDRETMLAERPRVGQALTQVFGRAGLTVKRSRPVTVPDGLTAEVFRRALDAFLPAGPMRPPADPPTLRAVLAGPECPAPDFAASFEHHAALLERVDALVLVNPENR